MRSDLLSHFLPRSVLVLPRSSDELPRWVFKLPRSDPKVPRSVSVLPRFAAEPAFAFPHLTGLFTPVAAPPRRIRASLGPARFTRVATQRQVPPAPQSAAVAAFVDQDTSRSVLIRRALNTERAAPVVHTSDCHRPAAPPMDGRYQEITVIRKVGFASSGCGTGELRFMPVNIG